MKRIVILILAIAFIASCATTSSGRRPRWMDDKYAQYSQEDYMVEIGQGASLKNAKANGAASLAQIFKTSIRVETSIQTRYKEFSSAGNTSSSEENTYDENITQLANQELINVNFGESWTNDLGQVHVLSYIDRQETAQIYRRRIMENSDTVERFLADSANQTSLFKQFAYLDAAYVVAEANRVLLEQLEIINMMMSKTVMISYDLDDIRAKRMSAAGQMAFAISIEGDEEGKIAAFLTDQLTSFGFAIDPSGPLAINGSLSFEKVELDNKYENMKYYLTINLVDEMGIPAISLEENERVSAISESDVVNRSYVEIKKIIDKDLMKKLTEYLDSYVK